MKKKSKIINIFVMIACFLIIVILGIMVYFSLFSSSNSERFEDINKYKLTKTEIKKVEETFKEVESLKSISVESSEESKIIKIFITLKEDVEVDKIKDISNSSLESFNEKNLGYYDFEIFVESDSEESEYPIIGYKHKENSKFSW